MSAPVTTLPAELLRNILLHLSLNDRLTFINSSQATRLLIARDIRWFVPLLVSPSLRNDAFAAIHAPRRGAREHIRQFRVRVETFLADYHAGLFHDKIPEPYLGSGGRPRAFPDPKVLARFHDLLALLTSISILATDSASKIDGNGRPRKRDINESVLNRAPYDSHGEGIRVRARGEDESAIHNDAYQANVHAAFFRLEVFRRLFYQNPLKPLFASGDVTAPQGANQRYSLSFRDAKAHGFATQWDNARRARLWNSEYLQLDKTWEEHRSHEPVDPQERARVKKTLAARHRQIQADAHATFSAFEVIWSQYALWVNNELREFKLDVVAQAEDVARSERRESDKFKARLDLNEPSSQPLFPDLPRIPSSLSKALDPTQLRLRNDQRQMLAARDHIKIGIDYEFAQHNMALVLPEREKPGKFQDDETVWPEMFRFLTFLTSLGLPFFYRCAKMDGRERRQMLGSVFLYLGRLPAHRVPQFVLGEVDPFSLASGDGFPLLGATRDAYLHPTFGAPENHITPLIRVASHLSYIMRLPDWGFLEKLIVSKSGWEKTLQRHATETIRDIAGLPFEVSRAQWERMQKPRFEARLVQDTRSCTWTEYVIFYEWAMKRLGTTTADYSPAVGLAETCPRDHRGLVQLQEMQKAMHRIGEGEIPGFI